jgi:hypothetical protein
MINQSFKRICGVPTIDIVPIDFNDLRTKPGDVVKLGHESFTSKDTTWKIVFINGLTYIEEVRHYPENR